MNLPVLTVSELNRQVRLLLESEPYLQTIYVSGEISNFTNHYRSGHMYFSLKDESALIRAVMFRSAASKLRFIPENGMHVVCLGRVSLYEKDGQYQFYVDAMEPEGEGALAVAYRQLLEKLRAEGLFDESRKRPLPRFPRNIAVVTSPTGAAVRDILNILGRRYPAARVILCPVAVQGESAPAQMIAALEEIARKGCADLIILGRGGGSVEELWAFNDENLARAVAACPVPVISAVGHETDYTVCDFAADLRAPTPSAAAELAVPDAGELLARLALQRKRIEALMKTKLDRCRHAFRLLSSVRALRDPRFVTDRAKERLDYLLRDLTRALRLQAAENRRLLSSLAHKLDALSPLKVLARGYTLLSGPDGRALTRAAEFRENEPHSLRFADGEARFVPANVALIPRGENDTETERTP